MRVMWALAALMVAAPVQAEVTTGRAMAVPLALDGLPRQTMAWTDHGKAQTCEGVMLRDLLIKAGAPSGDDVRGAALSMVIKAEAADGYSVVYSLGEVDAKLGAARLLVADRCDGAALEDADGPLRIVAAGVARGARSVRQLVKLTLISVGD
jgi:hypothetical protein